MIARAADPSAGPRRPTMRTRRPRRVHLAWAAPLAAGLWLLFLAVRHGGGVAGTDEYWYAGDLRMTAATRRAVSNHVYPSTRPGSSRARCRRGSTTPP